MVRATTVIAIAGVATVGALVYFVATASAQTSKLKLMYLSGAPEHGISEPDNLDELLKGNDKYEFVPWVWYWGVDTAIHYPFDFVVPESRIRADIDKWRSRGFKVGLYVDVSECPKVYADANCQDSEMYLTFGEPWPAYRMSLEPSKSWYRRLRDSMIAAKALGFDGYSLDRADILADQNINHVAYLNQLLQEVGGLFVLNTPQCLYRPIDVGVLELCQKAFFIGSDGVTLEVFNNVLSTYSILAGSTDLKRFYLCPDASGSLPMKTVIDKTKFTLIGNENWNLDYLLTLI